MESFSALKIENLLNWQTGFLSPKVDIKDGNFGVGVFANTKIEPDEILLRMKQENLITMDKALLVNPALEAIAYYFYISI